MKTQYKHIHFRRVTGYHETEHVWRCYANRGGDYLGLVAPGSWGCITFSPMSQTEFSDDCLADIIHFIGQVEAERNKPSGAERKTK